MYFIISHPLKEGITQSLAFIQNILSYLVYRRKSLDLSSYFNFTLLKELYNIELGEIDMD